MSGGVPYLRKVRISQGKMRGICDLVDATARDRSVFLLTVGLGDAAETITQSAEDFRGIVENICSRIETSVDIDVVTSFNSAVYKYLYFMADWQKVNIKTISLF